MYLCGADIMIDILWFLSINVESILFGLSMELSYSHQIHFIQNKNIESRLKVAKFCSNFDCVYEYYFLFSLAIKLLIGWSYQLSQIGLMRCSLFPFGLVFFNLE